MDTNVCCYVILVFADSIIVDLIFFLKDTFIFIALSPILYNILELLTSLQFHNLS